MTHYFSKKQTSQANEQTIKVRFAGYELPFFSASGIFSKDHLDQATRLLIEVADKELSKSLTSDQPITALDLGCGWGPVAVILKRLHPKINFIASDINERALEYTKKNVKKNKVEVEVISSNICEQITEPVNIILTNPPYAAGRETCYAFIEQAKDKLADHGSLLLVARHTKGGKMLMQKMEEVFGNVDTLAKSGGFRVYTSKKEN